MAMDRPRTENPQQVPGFASRRIAAEILEAVLGGKRPLDSELESNAALRGLSERDRALSRMLVATVLRRLGTLRHLLGGFLDRGFPRDAPRVQTALLLGAAQILLLDVPAHAAVDLSVRLVQDDRQAAHYAGLVNAVLRRVAREGQSFLVSADAVALDTPPWLTARWTKSYGADIAQAIAAANGQEPPLDLSVKGNPDTWATRLGARVLPTGSVRFIAHGPVSGLVGYAEGAWWVQDAAAALPARLFGDVRGMRVADLCAAPGGKSAQLASAGAEVTAIDRSASRLRRLRENFSRLGLTVETIVADATEWRSAPFDAVLLDAPCSSTGTIRRHPDIPWLKQESDLPALVGLQQRLLDNAAALTKPGGTLIYCVCSLEPEEGEDAIAALLARQPEFRRRPIEAAELFGMYDWLTPAGDLRTLPCHLPDPEPRMAGMDGFYAARLQRR
jgi:16S rRNA (cytosine967-C5)-methyltransferase